jgi:hypothetical protein
MLPIWEAQVHFLRIDPNLDRADRYLQFGDFFNGAQVRRIEKPPWGKSY